MTKKIAPGLEAEIRKIVKSEVSNNSGYNGWLTSTSFMKRAFAVLGHYFVSQLIVTIVLYGIIFVIYLVVLLMGTVAGY